MIWEMDTRGDHRFSSLMKQKIKGKNCAVFCFAGKRIFFIYLWSDYMGKKLKKFQILLLWSLSLATPINGSIASVTASGHPYCILCAKNSEMLKFVPTKKPMGFVVEAWDGSNAHHALCQICEHAQPQDQPLHATGRHPGDVLTTFQPLPTTRVIARAKKL
jgi:hypothetical protein